MLNLLLIASGIMIGIKFSQWVNKIKFKSKVAQNMYIYLSALIGFSLSYVFDSHLGTQYWFPKSPMEWLVLFMVVSNVGSMLDQWGYGIKNWYQKHRTISNKNGKHKITIKW